MNFTSRSAKVRLHGVYLEEQTLMMHEVKISNEILHAEALSDSC